MIFISEVEALGRLKLELSFAAVRQALIAAADDSGKINPPLLAHRLSNREVFGVKSDLVGRSADSELVVSR